MRRGGVTLVEVIVGTLIAILVVMVCMELMRFLFSTRSRSSLVAMTRRSFIQKDAKAGLRRLVYRLREAIQVLSPEPGTSADTLVFRDILNQKVRVRLDAGERRLVSEREEEGAWRLETGPAQVTVAARTVPAGWPVTVQNCTSVRFTAQTPECVVVEAGVATAGMEGAFMTLVKLRNAGMAY